MGRDVFYITTPIYYPNDVPHVGHAYDTVACDFVARYRRLRGEEVFHLTGTDEHGLKLQRAAEAQGMTPQEWVDEMEPKMEGGLGPAGHRVRRLHPDHGGPPHGGGAAAPQRGPRQRQGRHLPRDLRGPVLRLVRGLLHRGRADRRQLPDPRAAGRGCSRRTTSSACPPTRTGFSSTTRQHPEAVEPESRRNEVLSPIRGGLQDFSICRTTFDWGIPLPWDPKHVIYVWFDALTNYITAAGYADDARAVRAHVARGHPRDREGHPAVPRGLLAGDADGRRVEPPTQVWAHGFLTVGGEKMSKTNATGIHPFELLDLFGVDSYRYYFLREIQFGQDGSFSLESMVERHNADLANGLGNLASRVLAMLGTYFDGAVPAARSRRRGRPAGGDGRAAARYDAHARRRALAAVAAVWDIVERANRYLVEKEPWELKDESRRDELASILYASAETLRILAVLIYPVMPAAAQRLWAQLGLPGPSPTSGSRRPPPGAASSPARRPRRATACSRGSTRT